MTTAEVRRSALSRYDSGPRMRVVGLRIGLSLLAGALLFLAVPTYGLWPLMWIAALPQIYVARVAATPKRAFLYGWLTGAVAHTGGFYWMDGLLERFGHMAPIEALPIMALLIAYQGLAFAFFSWGVRPGLGSDRRAAGAAGAAGHGRRRAADAADLPLLPGHLAGVRAGGHPDRRSDRAAGRHGAHAGVQRRLCRSRFRLTAPNLAGEILLAGAGDRRGADRRRSRVRCAADPPGRRAPRRRAQGAHGPGAGQRRHHREVGPGGVRAPAGSAPAGFGRSAARRRRAGGLAGVVVPVRAAAHLRARLRRRRRAEGAARVRHLAACSARSPAPKARRRSAPIATPTTRQS